ncbi:hypothetical protein DFQ01_10171 [Paenibacillus cellulosilyticus]|uniref:Flagellar protein FliT n=1 Tax=Paenibacillus cellulosilyticus TaxID=375489 RepID=A0A2V2Z3G1_9BACL|nr:hypothetical protein [Paenibacillus cellulosilyticus]PWW08350.1 hypothetical protein DFQ01_10171 [Paenibacillus cellulosilyticus]QKS47948.1 hypothetical protein HUB94_27000 [Paenibacillus cellulosilyticus]
MTESIILLHEKTMDLVNRLETVEYMEWTALVELRDQTLLEVKQSSGPSEDEKQLLRQIGEFDSVIVARMLALKGEASRGLQNIAQSRQQRKMYQYAYTPGSFFFDKRK